MLLHPHLVSKSFAPSFAYLAQRNHRAVDISVAFPHAMFYAPNNKLLFSLTGTHYNRRFSIFMFLTQAFLDIQSPQYHFCLSNQAWGLQPVCTPGLYPGHIRLHEYLSGIPSGLRPLKGGGNVAE
jgi:hypothetical protein